MSRQSAPLTLSADERSELDCLIRSGSTPQQLALRARMIVLAADGVGVCETAQRLGVWRKEMSLWRARWLAGGGGETVAERLQDAPRSGAPATIMPEQICAIVALAGERPDDVGVPIRALAPERERSGARGCTARHRHLHIASVATLKPDASMCAASIAAPSQPRTRRKRCRSTR